MILYHLTTIYYKKHEIIRHSGNSVVITFEKPPLQLDQSFDKCFSDWIPWASCTIVL